MIKLIVNTTVISPQDLKDKIMSALKSHDKNLQALYLDDEGDISHLGYTYDTDSSGATYKSYDEYTDKAWLHFSKLEDTAIFFGLITRKYGYLTKQVYSWFHTTFAEFILNEFDEFVEEIHISSKLTKEIDIFNQNDEEH